MDVPSPALLWGIGKRRIGGSGVESDQRMGLLVGIFPGIFTSPGPGLAAPLSQLLDCSGAIGADNWIAAQIHSARFW